MRPLPLIVLAALSGPAFADSVPATTEDPEEGDGITEAGWVIVVRRVTGAPEVWAVRDDGSDRVQLTDGIDDPNNPEPGWTPHVQISPDGNRIAIGTRLQPDGTGGDPWRWMMDADGTNLAPLRKTGQRSSADKFSWRDNDYLLARAHPTCSDDIISVNAATGATATLKSVGNILWGPEGNPSDPDDLLATRYSCGSGLQTPVRIDLGSGSVTPLPGFAAGQGFTWMEFFQDGSGFVYTGRSPKDKLMIHDFSTSTPLYTSPDGGAVQGPYFGADDETVFVQHLPADGSPTRLLAIDVATGGATDLLVSDLIDRQTLSWAAIPFDIDCDDDGLGNGIDPTSGWDPATESCVTDADGDGLSDDVDACPLVAGTPADDADDNGCPDSLDVFSFDDATLWSRGTGVASPRTEGTGALSVTAVGWTPIESDPFGGDGLVPTADLAVDVYVPGDPPNPYWLGDLQMHVHCPDDGLYNGWAGRASFAGRALDEWHTLSFSLSSSAQAALGSGDDCRIRLNLNAPSGGDPFFFDDLRFE